MYRTLREYPGVTIFLHNTELPSQAPTQTIILTALHSLMLKKEHLRQADPENYWFYGKMKINLLEPAHKPRHSQDDNSK